MKWQQQLDLQRIGGAPIELRFQENEQTTKYVCTTVDHPMSIFRAECRAKRNGANMQFCRQDFWPTSILRLGSGHLSAAGWEGPFFNNGLNSAEQKWEELAAARPGISILSSSAKEQLVATPEPRS